MRVLGRVVCVTASFLLCVAAQGAVVPQRILSAIDPSQVSEVPGNVPAAARRGVDLGAVPGDLPLTDLSLRFALSAAQQTALDRLLADQQNPASGRYHQWITPEQFAAQFGLAPADIQKVSNWLANAGFTVTEVSRGGTYIRFSGTAALVHKAFHTEIHRVMVDGESHISNLTEPQLPSSVAIVTGAVTGLHDFRLKPQIHLRPRDAAGQQGVVQPQYTSSTTGNHFLLPADFYTIYDENALLTGGTNGTGSTIAVLGQSTVSASDISTFTSLAGVPANNFTQVVDGTSPGEISGDEFESDLDLEWAGAIAPSARVIFYIGKDVIQNSLTRAVNDNIAQILSLSYGNCEADFGLSYAKSHEVTFQQANAQGQTIVAAAGDNGATDCDGQVASATLGLATEWPATSPSITALGGTTFNEGTGTYWSATNAANMGSVLSYIPETVWNESIADGTLGAGGGGVSTFFTKPYWQVGNGVPADSARDIPDVSLNATTNHDGVMICSPGYCTSGLRNSAGNFDVVGGTSVATPEFAGLLALVVQKTGGRLGNVNPTIYALANSSLYGTVFHDVTTGGNQSPCTAGTPNCPAGGSIGYAAGVGYDRATGWGSVDSFNMVNNWTAVTPLVSPIGLSASNTTVSGTPSAVVQGTNINLTSTTTPAGATGTVQFLLDNVAQGSPVAINGSGVATFTLNTASIPNGAHTVTAAYSGDATYAGSEGSFGITITSSGVPDFSITPATSTVTVASGSTAMVAFTVNGLNSFSGNVNLTVNSVTNEVSSLSSNTISLLNTKTAGFSTLTIFAYRANAVPGQSARSKALPMPWSVPGSGVALAGILFLVLPKRRRFVGALAAVLSVGLFAASGCGGGGSTQLVQNTNTAPGTYTITISGSGTSGTTTATHTATVTLTVQ